MNMNYKRIPEDIAKVLGFSNYIVLDDVCMIDAILGFLRACERECVKRNIPILESFNCLISAMYHYICGHWKSKPYTFTYQFLRKSWSDLFLTPKLNIECSVLLWGRAYFCTDHEPLIINAKFYNHLIECLTIEQKHRDNILSATNDIISILSYQQPSKIAEMIKVFHERNVIDGDSGGLMELCQAYHYGYIEGKRQERKSRRHQATQ